MARKEAYFHSFSDGHTQKVCKMCGSYTHGVSKGVFPGKSLIHSFGTGTGNGFLKPERKLRRNLMMNVLHCFPLAPFVSAMCVVEVEKSASLVVSMFLSSDADRHAELSGSPLKSKSTRKPLACIIGYLGGYFLIDKKLKEPFLYL